MLCGFTFFIYYNIDIQPYTDLEQYQSKYYYYNNLSLSKIIYLEHKDVTYHILARIISSFGLSFSFFLGIMAAICVLMLALALRWVYSKDFVMVLCLFFLSPFFLAGFSNVVRQGISMSILVVAICASYRYKSKIGIIFLFVLSSLFHIVSLMYLAFYFMIKSNISTERKLISVWLTIAFLQFLGLGSYFTNYITPFLADGDRLGSYVNTFNHSYVTGFRFDFFLFSLSIYLFIRFFNRNNFTSLFSKYYIMNCIVYQLLCFIPFSDRILLFSWFMVPFALFIDGDTFQRINERFMYIVSFSTLGFIFLYNINKLQFTIL
ncbi:EpsG family protein [Vibrio breoganii]